MLKTAPTCFFLIFDIVKPGIQCIFNSVCTYLIIVNNFRFIFGSVVLALGVLLGRFGGALGLLLAAVGQLLRSPGVSGRLCGSIKDVF